MYRTVTLAAERTAQRRRRSVLFLLVLGLVSAGAGASSLALFTDQETVTGSFTTGTIVLDEVRINALTLTTGAMMPGDSITDDVVVENDGSAQLRYAMTTASTNPDTKAVHDVLTLTVKTIDFTTPATPCDNFDGSSTLYTGVLGASAAGFGSPIAGAHGGDRTLNAGISETLCFRVTLPQTTGTAYQGATTTTTFTFDAEQTANNP